jgi:hypothetical protein
MTARRTKAHGAASCVGYYDLKKVTVAESVLVSLFRVAGLGDASL